MLVMKGGLQTLTPHRSTRSCKSTLVQQFTSQGYHRINRDLSGGTMADQEKQAFNHLRFGRGDHGFEALAVVAMCKYVRNVRSFGLSRTASWKSVIALS